jgi:NAD(P)-dependent dehydrogenase (short-subunit alcohol dehydrogenase family)
MAEEGARVVAHDAEGLVPVIRESGGEAVACFAALASWEGSKELVRAAKDHFGRLDILVNHMDSEEAPQDRMISEISRESWERAEQAHLKASFLCTRAALPCMRKQKQGRLIHLTSAEAVVGAVGHTHDGAAQMAVVGLSRNAAIEMERYRVTSNCIVPCSGPGSVSDPADVAPLTVFLASDGAQGLSGQIFGVRGKEILLFSQSRIQRSIHNSRGWTVEKLSESFELTMRSHFVPLEFS